MAKLAQLEEWGQNLVTAWEGTHADVQDLRARFDDLTSQIDENAEIMLQDVAAREKIVTGYRAERVRRLRSA